MSWQQNDSQRSNGVEAMSEPKVVCEAKQWLPKLDPIFQRGVHIIHAGTNHLDVKLASFVKVLTSVDTYACTCSVFDVLAADSLRYVRNPGQRCFAMYFRQHPGAIGDSLARLAIIHEAAHYVSCVSPARDLTDERAAAQLWARRPDGDGGPEHDSRWLRASAHLAFRAAAVEGLDIDIQRLLAPYAIADAVMGSLRPELRDVSTPIESILATRPPEKFRKFCDLIFGGQLPTTSKPTDQRGAAKAMPDGNAIIDTMLDSCATSGLAIPRHLCR